MPCTYWSIKGKPKRFFPRVALLSWLVAVVLVVAMCEYVSLKARGRSLRGHGGSSQGNRGGERVRVHCTHSALVVVGRRVLALQRLYSLLRQIYNRKTFYMHTFCEILFDF